MAISAQPPPASQASRLPVLNWPSKFEHFLKAAAGVRVRPSDASAPLKLLRFRARTVPILLDSPACHLGFLDPPSKHEMASAANHSLAGSTTAVSCFFATTGRSSARTVPAVKASVASTTSNDRTPEPSPGFCVRVGQTFLSAFRLGMADRNVCPTGFRLLRHSESVHGLGRADRNVCPTCVRFATPRGLVLLRPSFGGRLVDLVDLRERQRRHAGLVAALIFHQHQLVFDAAPAIPPAFRNFLVRPRRNRRVAHHERLCRGFRRGQASRPVRLRRRVLRRRRLTHGSLGVIGRPG